MAYTESKTNWSESTQYTVSDQNRVENNIKALAEDAITIEGVKTFSGNNIHNGADIHNDNEVHNGNETFNGNDIYNGDETFNGDVEITNSTANIKVGSVETNNIQELTKKFTGSVSGSGGITITHGLDINKMYSVSGIVHNQAISPASLGVPLSTVGVFSISSTTISITISDGQYYGDPYKLIIKYEA